MTAQYGEKAIVSFLKNNSQPVEDENTTEQKKETNK